MKWCELFYKKVEAAVVTGHKMMQWFEVDGGLRQGSLHSPLLYSIFIMDLVNELEDSGDRARVEEAYCGMLMFADDMAVVAESEEGMGRMLDKADAYSKKWRFKVMVIAGRQRREKQKWWLGNKEVEGTEDFKYLGVWMDAKLKRNAHMEKRIERAVEANQRVGWMGRVNGVMETAQQKKLDAVQEQVGRKVLGAS